MFSIHVNLWVVAVKVQLTLPDSRSQLLGMRISFELVPCDSLFSVRDLLSEDHLCRWMCYLQLQRSL